MNIGIIGLGTVGNATAYLFHLSGYYVVGYDIDPKKTSPYIDERAETIEDVGYTCHITFIATPEHTIEEVIKELVNTATIPVIRSSTIPGTTKTLTQKYSKHICHNPEFLREATALQDILNPDRIIIGACCANHAQLLKAIYRDIHPKTPIYVTNPTTSELVKLVNNAYLATLISFWNEVAEITEKLNVDTHEVAHLVGLDKRVSPYGKTFFKKPYGGKCLPKDLNHLIDLCHKLNINPAIFEAVRKINRKLGGK